MPVYISLEILGLINVRTNNRLCAAVDTVALVETAACDMQITGRRKRGNQ
jgi:hypothetical protein